MSRLVIHNDSVDLNAGKVAPLLETDDHAAISRELAAIGVRFERWPTKPDLSADAGSEQVLELYVEEVDHLNAEYGFQSIDVVSLRPDHPQAAEMRAKFLAEHTHADFEVRFFVDGSGLFYLHVADKVLMVDCEAGDLISVPAGTPHWFDMGAAPNFKCIRFFVIPDGWVAEFSGSGIADHFPDYDSFRMG